MGDFSENIAQESNEGAVQAPKCTQGSISGHICSISRILDVDRLGGGFKATKWSDGGLFSTVSSHGASKKSQFGVESELAAKFRPGNATKRTKVISFFYEVSKTAQNGGVFAVPGLKHEKSR